jgi:purine-cytosine permease-like protein
MRYRPKVGKEFPVSSFKEKTQYLTERTRSVIAIAVVGAAILALLVAALVSTHRGNFGPLLATWGVVGPMLGVILGHYFPNAGKGDDEDHTSTA